MIVTSENNKLKIGYPGLGIKIRNHRRRAKYSQITLAEKLGISWMTVLRWERYDRTIELGMLEKVAVLFNVDLDYMLSYDRV